MRIVIAIAIATLILPSRALASPTYPDVIASVTGAPAPPCTVCHQTAAGGLGTATKPLAVYLRSRGLVASDEASLRNALAAAEAEHHDSDGDGISDFDELKAGTNPNEPPSADDQGPPPPEYGCGNVSGGPPPGAEGGLLFVVGALLARRRRLFRGDRTR
jgi:MYXO-CTERM domain-containing protein